MDEKLRDLVDMMLAERFSIAFQAMKHENKADATQESRLIDLNEQIEHHPGISGEAREILRQFLTLDFNDNMNCQRYLYIQGAKDCVAVLRELDVIR